MIRHVCADCGGRFHHTETFLHHPCTPRCRASWRQLDCTLADGHDGQHQALTRRGTYRWTDGLSA